MPTPAWRQRLPKVSFRCRAWRWPLCTASVIFAAQGCISATVSETDARGETLAKQASPCGPKPERDAVLIGGMPGSDRALAHARSLAAAYRMLYIVDLVGPVMTPAQRRGIRNDLLARYKVYAAELEKIENVRTLWRTDAVKLEVALLEHHQRNLQDIDFWFTAPSPQFLDGQDGTTSVDDVILSVLVPGTRIYVISEQESRIETLRQAWNQPGYESERVFLATSSPNGISFPLPLPYRRGGADESQIELRSVSVFIDSHFFDLYTYIDSAGVRRPRFDTEITGIGIRPADALLPLR